MTTDEFDTQFTRLTAHFHLAPDVDRLSLSRDWFEALAHYHIDAVSHAMTELIRTEQERYWPALGKVLGMIHSRMGRYDRTPGKCETCHGSTWVEAHPWRSNGMVYEGLQRCPDCGVPAPPAIDRPYAQPLTATELHAFREAPQPNLMPSGLEAKPWKPGARDAQKADMIAAFARLRVKLFGEDA